MTTPITFPDCQDLWGAAQEAIAEAEAMGAQVSRYTLVDTGIHRDKGEQGQEFWSTVRMVLFVHDHGIPFCFELKRLLDEPVYTTSGAVGKAAKHRDAVIKQAKAAGYVVLEGGELC